jgi:hypothetical protein
MPSYEDLEGLPWPRAGRLDETAEILAIRAMLHGPQGPGIWLPNGTRKSHATRPVTTVLGPGYRALSFGATPTDARASTFHLGFSSTSRRPPPQTPRDVQRGRRVGLWPARGEIHLLKQLPDAKRHRGARMWSLPVGHMFLRTPIGQVMSSELAKVAAFVGREVDPKKRALDRCRKHQRYVERSGGYTEKHDDIEKDDQGPILVGNIGANPKARKAFWIAANSAEERRDARVQDRLILELPHWVSASDRRAIVERFGQEFGRLRLGWFAAVHLPDKHGDERNFHAHFVIGTRPILTMPSRSADETESSSKWTFAPTKNRDTQGKKWVTYLRHRFAAIVNEVAVDAERRGGPPVERIFYPGRSIEIGITKPPGEHLGPVRAAFQRRGHGNPQHVRSRSLYEVIESCIRAHERDREAIARATEEMDILLDEFAPADATMKGRLACIVAVDKARIAVDACRTFLERILADSYWTLTASKKPAGGDDRLELADLLWRFNRSGELVAVALDSIEKFRAEMARLTIEQRADRERDRERPAPSEERHAAIEAGGNEIGIDAKTQKLDAVDSKWVFDEIARRLKRNWIPRKIEDGKPAPIVRRSGDGATLTIGDALELRLTFTRKKGWEIEYPTPGYEEDIKRASYERRFWHQVIGKLIGMTTLSLGAARVREILERHGLAAEPSTHGGKDVIEVRRANGTLRVAADGHEATVEGGDPVLRAAFLEIRDARDRLMLDTRVLAILHAERRPMPEGDPDRVDRPISLTTLERAAFAKSRHAPMAWCYDSENMVWKKPRNDAAATFQTAAPASAPTTNPPLPHNVAWEPAVTTNLGSSHLVPRTNSPTSTRAIDAPRAERDAALPATDWTPMPRPPAVPKPELPPPVPETKTPTPSAASPRAVIEAMIRARRSQERDRGR